MIKQILATVLLLSAHIVTAATGQPPASDEVVAGKLLYEQYCIACHGEKGVGERPIPRYLRAPGYFTAMPLDESSHAWHHTDEQLIQTIREGLQRTARMPAWKGVVSEAQAARIVAYMKSLWSPRILACQGPKHMSCM